MADVTTTSPLTTPKTGGLNFADYQERIKKAAEATRATGKTSDTAMESAQKAASFLAEPRKAVGTAAIESYKQQAAGQKQQAEKAASGLEMAGESTLRGVQNIENIQEQMRTNVKSASETWGVAAEKADEYVKASRSRVGEVLNKLDELNADFAKERNFAKAHAMQASAQAVLGSMKEEERNITENYGTDSKEYQQFRASKMSTLATVQSNIHASYQQLAEQQKQTYMNTVSDAYTKSNMYVGFQEQQHVEMLKYSEEAKTGYALKAAELDVTFEQMKMQGMENIANWIIETPSFTMDMTPLMTLLSDLKTTETEEQRANMLATGQANLLYRQAQESMARTASTTAATTRANRAAAEERASNF